MTSPLINTVVIQFAKAPAFGKVKTRLQSVLTDVQRNELHCAMTAWTCQQLYHSGIAHRELWVDGDGGKDFFQQLKREFNCELFSQVGNDLGERMKFAAERALQKYDQVIIVGSDCPFITPDYLVQAINALVDYSTVFGPADDGGYVLLGLRELETSLFGNIPWGGDRVLSTSVKRLESNSESKPNSFRLLESLADIDRPEDLSLLRDNNLPQALQKFAN